MKKGYRFNIQLSRGGKLRGISEHHALESSWCKADGITPELLLLAVIKGEARSDCGSLVEVVR